LQRVKIDRGRV